MVATKKKKEENKRNLRFGAMKISFNVTNRKLKKKIITYFVRIQVKCKYMEDKISKKQQENVI